MKFRIGRFFAILLSSHPSRGAWIEIIIALAKLRAAI